MSTIAELTALIASDPANQHKTNQGIKPLFTASPKARIVIVGQAPGRIAEETRKPWNDVSGRRLREWLNISDKDFYSESISLLPMDFYYPGKGKSGDLPPRPDFAQKWHPRLLALMPDIQLIVLVGSYAQKYYLGKNTKQNLTETVRTAKSYLPRYLPLVHPSPLNQRWLSKNPWFQTDILPLAKKHVQRALK